MTQKEFDANKAYLENNDVEVLTQRWWDEKPFSAELECYTDGGGDMIINLEELTRSAFEEYLEGFDINEEVAMWWTNGRNGGVPFDNIKDHYIDLEEWLERLSNIVSDMPY